MSRPSIIIVGAGLTGLALALRLLERSDLDCQVHVIECEDHVGGLAGTFDWQGIHFDYGSHRLHPAIAPEDLAYLKTLLDPDLLLRPRKGRILLNGRFVGYPLRPLNLAANLPPQFLLGIFWDAVTRPFRGAARLQETYASVLERSLGPTITRAFYFPYARKLWGLSPDEIAAEQARRRVSAGSLMGMVRRVLSALPGLGTGMSGQSYYYPRRGFGQIANALADAVRAKGGQLHLNAHVSAIHLSGRQVVDLHVQGNDGARLLAGVKPDRIFSTIPLPDLVRLLDPLPEPIRTQAESLRYRAIVFCYLVLRTNQFTPYDAHYFPADDFAISRLSEPKNYSGDGTPHGLTGLCVEIPCWPQDAIWQQPAEVTAAQVLDELARAGLGVTVPVEDVFVRRQRHAYPVYDLGFAEHLQALEAWITAIPELVTLGRQGLFAHDNIHHALAVAQSASNCLLSGGIWQDQRWVTAREGFREHVVVD